MPTFKQFVSAYLGFTLGPRETPEHWLTERELRACADAYEQFARHFCAV